ncbi:MAG: acyl carrier protein [Butyrivibrio sp.]|uniref:phosphopantetheine-binding protein n=1 Tax=Butyrivibrio sp. TaxID=28121 RepID=UPI0025C00A45|nr:phosphopantetheine-binding protein [Butyrivibrio sp.]MBQ6587222.1 acyl carrier protein [Butyrivibrio sp.]
MEELIAVLKSVKEDVDFENEQALVSDELLESMDIVAIVSELENHYGITIDLETLVPENFESARSIMKMIESLQNE